jgi:ABC-type Na+ efflux pump permease subunit
MNPLVKKEIRLLMPAWIVAMILATVPYWIVEFFDADVITANVFRPPCFIMFGMLFLGITSFGSEISFKTFPLLLSQPVPRGRIWWTKISLLGTAFLSILAASMISWSLLGLCHLDHFPGLLDAFGRVELWIYVFAFFLGSLWTTLLLRQTIGAFWMTLFVPMAILVVINIVFFSWSVSDAVLDAIVSTAFVAYSIAGFIYAKKLFMQAQDTQWLEGIFTLTWRKGDSEQATGSILPGWRHGLAALFLKEVQIHQVNILIAVVVLVLHVASVLVRKIHPHFDDPYIRYILEEVWALWLLMPLLIGCSAIAEERKLGIVESQLCLPVSRRVQMFAKLLVALVLGLVLGGIMPSLVEKTDMDGSIIFEFAAVIFFISFYASSISRTTIQAIGLAILAAVIVGGLQIAFLYISFACNSFLKGYMGNGYVQLEIFLAAIILLLLFVGLSFRNFKWLHQTAKVLRHDAIALVLSFLAIAVLTNAIYFRTWEFLMASEPAHGPARLSASDHPNLLIGDDAIYARLSDGRLWAEQIQSHNVYGSGNRYLSAGGRFWVDGSNWTSVAVCNGRLLAIQSDGTLWAAQSSPGPFQLTMKRVGEDTNWTQIATDQSWDFNFLLLRSDGTLWYSSVPPIHSSHSIKLPQHIMDGTNFSAIFSSPFGYIRALKNDGSVWFVSLYGKKPGLGRVKMMPEFVNDIQFGRGFVSLNTNGDLTFSPYQGRHHKGVQIGGNVKWKAIAPAGNNFGLDANLLAIRDDGTLWEFKSAWLRGESDEAWLKHIRIIQLGVHSDWISLISASEPEYGTRALTLSGDGGLWGWDLPSTHVWLIPSRRPTWFGNIYQAASGNP